MLPKKNTGGFRHVGAVIYSVNPSLLGGRAIEASDLRVTCSCSIIIGGVTCPHLQYCASTHLIAHNILKMPTTAYRSDSEVKLRCVLVGPRIGSTSAIWVVILNDPQSHDELVFVPVVESRDKKHMYMSLARRMNCMHCRRSSANRSLCDHETVAIQAAQKLENPETVLDST